jgi:hypothetical protein
MEDVVRYIPLVGHRALRLLVVAAFVAACGGDAAKPEPVPAPAPSMSLPAPDAGGSRPGDSGSPLPYFGTVYFEQSYQGSKSSIAQITSGPQPTRGNFPLPGQACAAPGMSAGPCCYRPSSEALTDGNAAPPTLAGTIVESIDNTAIADLVPGGVGGYSVANNLAWMPGDTLAIRATGGAIHSFTGSVAAPAPIVGLSLTESNPVQVPTSADLAVSWTAGNATTVSLVVYGPADLSGATDSIACFVDDSAGTVTVPTALLAHMPVGDASWFVWRMNTATTTCDNATIGLLAEVESTGEMDLVP